jgi:PAS domain S-box-containing protein
MEGELRTTKEFLENLINSSVDAIVAADMNGNIMLFNKGAEKMYGYRADDVIGRMHVTQLYPGVGAAEVMLRLREGRYGGAGRLAPERREILTAGGDVVPVSMSASIIYEDGEEVATVGVFTDLRDRMAIERQLNEARDQLTKAERARVAAELAGMAAHELNQPLTSVLGYAEMLKARIPESDVKLRRPIETIFTQAERMAEIVRKIGRVTKYETKRYGGKTDMIDLNRAIEDAAAKVDGDGIPSTSTPSSFIGIGRPPAPPATSLPPSFADDDFTDPRRQRITTPPGASSPQRSVGVMAALMSRGEPSASLASSADPRSAVIRMDTIDEEPPGYARRLKTPPAGLPRADDLSVPTGSFRGPLRSVHIDNVPGGGDDDEHTNPGVRISDLRRRTTPSSDT